MEGQTLYGKYENVIFAGIMTVSNAVLAGICFDFYYDLNDDMMMKDIMAGVYSGVPDGHNMQTLYVLGALISLGYRVCRTVPWYGLFLCLCQFASFGLAAARLNRLTERRTGRLIMMLLTSLFFWAVWLPHLVNVQYTITCAMMAAAAVFLFVTTPQGLSVQQFVVKNIPSMALVILAYQLRTEMLLLMLPFIGLAGVVRWAAEKPVFTRQNWRKYGAVLGIMLAGMAVSSGADLAAYGSGEWAEFRNFFDARTTVYDFYLEVVTQDAYAEALAELGVSEAEQTLLCNYNFGMDDAIDAGMLDRIAAYAAESVGGAKEWGALFREKIKLYSYRTFHGADAPYNILTIWAYGAVFLAGILSARADGQDGLSRRLAFLWQLALLAVVRSGIWMFILIRGRDPERITHSLYLAEFVLLLSMLSQMVSAGRRIRGALCGMTVLLILIQAGSLADTVRDVASDQDRRGQINRSWYDIDDYCRRHADNFYFEDVYSTVAFSQKMFADVDNTYANYDILGGWISKSPLYREKLARHDIKEADRALAERDDVFLIIADTEVREQGLDWILEYYAAENIEVSVRKSDIINERYGVYRIDRVE